MAFTFKGTYTKNRGDEVAAGTVDIVSKRGVTLDTATLDENGSYELVLSAQEGEVTVIETLEGVVARSYPVSVSRGSTTDTSRDIGYVGPTQSGASVPDYSEAVDGAALHVTLGNAAFTLTAAPEVTADGGVWTITFDGDTTTDLAFDADDEAITPVLEALPSIGAGNVDVGNGGSILTAVVITFLGDPAHRRGTDDRRRDRPDWPGRPVHHHRRANHPRCAPDPGVGRLMPHTPPVMEFA